MTTLIYRKKYLSAFTVIMTFIIVLYSTDDFRFKSSVHPKKTEHAETGKLMRYESPTSQPNHIVISELKKEIKSLKTEVNQIKQQLSTHLIQQGQFQSDNGLTKEEIQALEATQSDYDQVNESNSIEAAEQIESVFSEQEENIEWANSREIAIEQTLKQQLNQHVSILDLRCKSSLCRIELKYDLAVDENLEFSEDSDQPDISTSISSLLDAAVSKEINEETQTGIAVVFLGEPE